MENGFLETIFFVVVLRQNKVKGLPSKDKLQNVKEKKWKNSN